MNMKLDLDDIPKHHLRNDYFEKPQPAPVDALTIFLAVLSAILVAFFLREVYTEYQLRRAAAALTQTIEVNNQQLQQSVESIRRKQEANRQAQLERLNQQRLDKYRTEKQKQAAISASIEERRKKSDAWASYFKPSKDCESTNDNIDLIACGNAHLKAKKQFDKMWANEQLR